MAQFALIVWPLLALIVFARLPVLQALIWVVLLPYLFLPEATAIELPGLPDLTKSSVISLGVVLCLLLYRPKITEFLRGLDLTPTHRGLESLVWVCFGAALIGTVVTVLTNTKPVFFELYTVPGTRPWDIVNLSSQLVVTLIPFWLAMKYLGTPETQRALLKAFAVGTLIYSVFMLIEIRLSPQLHMWVYGYHQHSFLQHIRDGFRPMVFMQHGLWVGFFVFMGLLSAATLWKVTKDRRWLYATLWIFVTLAISENLGAFMIGVPLLGVLLVFRRRLQTVLITTIAAIILIYPAMRQASLLPIDPALSVISSFAPERAGSLGYRFDNEDLLLDKALRKPLTGWGGWNRNNVYTDLGIDISVAEGRWIIVLGQFGWVGYLSLFGLLCVPLILLARVRKRKEVPLETAALGLIAAGNLIYMIPNATLTPIGWLVFGAIAGFIIHDAKAQSAEATVEETGRGRAPRFTRFADTDQGLPTPGRANAATARFSRRRPSS